MILKQDLVAKAMRVTGITVKTQLVHAGLEALIARRSGERLAAMGGQEPKLRSIPRRRATS